MNEDEDDWKWYKSFFESVQGRRNDSREYVEYDDDSDDETEDDNITRIELSQMVATSSCHAPLINGRIGRESAVATHCALHGGLSPEKEQEIREFYDRLDIDHDGSIDIRDLILALKHEAPHIPVKLAPQLLSRMAPENYEKIGFNDFANYYLTQEQRLAEMFAEIDKGNDGFIDSHKVQDFCNDMGVPVDEEKAKTIVKKMDHNGNVHLKEFQEFMLLYPSSDLRDIVDFWRHNLMIDIGEDSLVPEDFSPQEMQKGIWWRHLVAGAAAGAVSRTCTAPFDRIKIYLQVNSNRNYRIGLLNCVRLLHAEGGTVSFWRGNGINVIKIAPESAIKFMFYDQIKRMIQSRKNGRDLTSLERLVAGSAAGAISQTIIYPLEVLKTRLALRRTGQLDRGIAYFAYKMYAKEGLRCFYKGYVPNLIGIIPYAGIDLAIYEHLKRMYSKYYGNNVKEPGVIALLACGTCSSTCGQLASYPFALIKTKLQALTVSKDVAQPKTMLGQFRFIMRNEGVVGFYRGLTPNFLKVIPAVSISYVVYEKVRTKLGVSMC